MATAEVARKKKHLDEFQYDATKQMLELGQ
jgi:hypothetical protein